VLRLEIRVFEVLRDRFLDDLVIDRYRLELAKRVFNPAKLILEVGDRVDNLVLLDEVETFIEREVEADQRGIDRGRLVDAEQLQVLESQLRRNLELRR
jgi:hypothetical protein